MKTKVKRRLSILIALVSLLVLMTLIKDDYVIQYTDNNGDLVTEKYERLPDYEDRVVELQELGVRIYR